MVFYEELRRTMHTVVVVHSGRTYNNQLVVNLSAFSTRDHNGACATFLNCYTKTESEDQESEKE